ncbi:MAG TPA: AAA family ATPase [Gemmatimonadaceae bacterium]|nr:AAA family ATPase [Gemmatimonadaceae bacterium]
MIRLRSLGECVLELDGAQLLPDAEVLFGTALYLVVERERTIERGALLRLLWPAATERQASHNLRQALYRLRAMGAPIVGDRTRVGIATEQVEADYDFLQRSDGHVARELLLQHVHGGFLRTYMPTFSTPFRDWLERQRHVIDALARRALVGAILTERGRGEWRTVDALARVCLEVDPLNEEATLALAEATALAGGKSQALAIIDEYLQELGPAAGEIRLPAILLRRRVAETAQYSGSLHTRPVPFVGRSADIAMLSRALHRAQSGRGNGILLWGEPGIGKTRLVSEFTGPALVRRAVVARASCQAMDEKRPLSAFVDLVPRLLALPGGLGVSPETMSYLRRLTEHDSEQTTLSPEAADAEFLFASIRRALTDLLDAVATEEALIVLIEDVQWLDVMSWKLLEEFLPWMEQRRILLLLTSREGDVPERRGIVQLPSLRRHLVAPLEPAAARDLVRQVVTDAGREASDAFLTWCASAGGGNPYYLRELALHAIEEGGSYRAPGTLMDLITERLQRLRPSSLRVLQACAILGQHSTLERVEAVVGMGRAELLDSLDELEGHRVIRAESSGVVAAHDLLGSAALSQMSQLGLRALHTFAANSLQRFPGEGNVIPILSAVAEHCASAGENSRAVALFRDCARHAVDIGLPALGIAQVDRALGLTRDAEQRDSLLQTKLEAAQLAAQWADVLSTHDDILRTHDGSPTDRQVLHDSNELACLHARWMLRHSLSSILARLVRCVQCRSSTEAHRREAAFLGIRIADNELDPDIARQLFTEAFGQPGALADDNTSLAACLVFETCFGDISRTPALARAMLARLQEVATPRVTAIRHTHYAAIALFSAGDVNDGRALLTSAYEHLVPLGAIGLLQRTMQDLFWMAMQLGDYEAAREWQDRTVASTAGHSEYTASAATWANAAELALYDNDLPAARRYLSKLESAFFSENRSRRAIAYVASLRAHVNAAESGWLLSESEHVALAALYERAKTLIAQDFLANAYCQSLAARCEHQTAHDVLYAYVHQHRRCRFPLPGDLVVLAGSLNVPVTASTKRDSSLRTSTS